MLTIYNYGLLNFVNDYSSDVKNKIFKYNNVAGRMMNDLKALSGSNRMILIDIPAMLPSISELDAFATKPAVANLIRLDYKYYNLIELWKWLTPSVKNNSIFDKIANHKLDATTLMLSMETKIVLLNLGTLYSIVDEYKDNKYRVNSESLADDFFKMLGYELNHEALGGIQSQYPAEMVRNLLYILLFQLINGKSVNLERIQADAKDFEVKELMSRMKKIQKETKISLSSIIKDFAITEKSDTIDLTADTDFDDSVFDTAKLEAEEAALLKSINRTFDSIEELKKYNYRDDVKLNTAKEIVHLYESKLISKKQYENFLESMEKQDKIKNPYATNETIDGLLDFDSDSFEIDDKATSVNKSVLLFDEAVSKDVLKTMEQKYLQEQYRKDIIRSVYSIQNMGNIILSYKVNTRTDIMSTIEEHQIEVLNLAGKKTTLTFEIPYIDHEGTMRLGSQVYKMRFQRADRKFL